MPKLRQLLSPALMQLLLLLLLQWSAEVGARTITACEGNRVTLSCPLPTAQGIIVRSATFGRRTDPPGSPGRCGDNLVVRQVCEVDVTQLIKYRCEGKPMCEVYVDVATFGVEMCVDVRKYIEVIFDCVQKFTVQSVQQCYKGCLPAVARHQPMASKQGWSKTQIPGPAAGNFVAAAHASPASSSARPSAAAPSPPRASSSSSSSASGHPAPSSSPGVPGLPYGNPMAAAMLRAGATSLRGGTGNVSRAPARVSAATKSQLLGRIQRILTVLRERKMAQAGGAAAAGDTPHAVGAAAGDTPHAVGAGGDTPHAVPSEGAGAGAGDTPHVGGTAP